MTEQAVILNRLLNKYENSKHLTEPGTFTRRVMLQVEKKELPEYRYEDMKMPLFEMPSMKLPAHFRKNKW